MASQVVELSTNVVNTTARLCVINPKTLKYVFSVSVSVVHRSACGVASTAYVRIRNEHGSVILKVELDGKAPVGRCFVPSVTFNYLGNKASVSLPPSLPVLDTVQLTPVHEDRACRMASGAAFRKHVSNFLDSMVLSDSEPVIVSMNGSCHSFKIECVPSEGIFAPSHARISVKIGYDETGHATSIGFKIVGGLSGIIEELTKTVKKPLLEGEVYRKYGIQPPRGILLYGPPGTGKTLIAKALGDELPGVLVHSVKGTDLCGGDSDSKIHTMFQNIRRMGAEQGSRGAVIFIDEIDSLCPSRDAGVTEAERRAVAALLTEMDGFDSKSAPKKSDLSIVILGATNRPNAIDIALRRPGRFERELEIPPPDVVGRMEILRIFAEHRFSAIWHPTEKDLAEIAGLTHGFVGADLLSLITQSVFKAVEAGATGVATRDILAQLIHVRPSALRELAITVPRTRWTDIGGYEDVKSQLIEAVIWPIAHADQFLALSVEPPRGVLLYGPPGCSKTMMARAIATESSMNFIAVKGPEIFSKWVGESEQAIRDLFRKARQASPCVIFFDEIDAIATQRGGDEGVSNRVLTQILTEMDGVSTVKQVVVVAATNRPQVLDPALLRPGRLDRLVYVGLPDDQARKSIVEAALKKVPHVLGEERNQYETDLVKATDGFTGAEIVMLVKEAAIECMRMHVKKPDNINDLTDELASLAIAAPETPKLRWMHMQTALARIQPRTDPRLIDSFMAFKNRTTVD